SRKMKEAGVNVWLVNTGWSAGPYGVGHRMKLKYTRAMITAALNGKLDNVGFSEHEVFGLMMPDSCPNVPDDILHPRNTWADKDKYDKTASSLAQKFNNNFQKFAEYANEEILSGAPKVTEKV
ncbi:MAG: phosphoenolpyruvate carboxykinase (ATP), partial [Owenweeksia sp.]